VGPEKGIARGEERAAGSNGAGRKASTLLIAANAAAAIAALFGVMLLVAHVGGGAAYVSQMLLHVFQAARIDQFWITSSSESMGICITFR
jgi:hypothetical protein